MDNRKYQQPATAKGSKSLDPNDMLLLVPYAFSLNINPKRLKGNYGFDYNIYKPVLHTIFKHTNIKWRGALEYNRFGRLHYHGYVIFESMLAIGVFYESLMSIDSYNYEIDTIEKIDDWTTYIFKSKGHMGELASFYSLPYVLGERQICPIFKTQALKDRQIKQKRDLKEIKALDVITEYE